MLRQGADGAADIRGGVVAEWLARSTRVSKDTGSNPAEAGHYVTTVGKLFTPYCTGSESSTY